MDKALNDFNELLHNTLGIVLHKYQEHVARSISEKLDSGLGFLVVSMPTGSGKTLLEIYTAFYLMKYRGFSKILVLEPTRFLCDQMFPLWSRVFNGIVGREYEGNCDSFLDSSKRIVISTPQTALKCLSNIKEEYNIVLIDEVHHAFGGKYYSDLLLTIKPKYVIGFTALLPSYRKYELDPEVENITGEPYILQYDFRDLASIDREFEPPKAIADLFDTEFSEIEDQSYNILFKGEVAGQPGIGKLLEYTLVRYGREAFCESYQRAIKKNNIIPHDTLDKLCEIKELSHKARTLIEILKVYGIRENNELKPVLVFTSRKRTAYEFREAITKHLRIPRDKIIVLTSDVDREKRKELIKEARQGQVDVIITTRVGEEGIDIPEAGLLIMMDTPKNPLRFYQRIGRLIRISSRRKIKYLVLALTPKTMEYYDLEEALHNLYREGVDLSYIVVNIGEKLPIAKIVDIIEEFSKAYGEKTIPFSLVILNKEKVDPIELIVNNIKENEENAKLLVDHLKGWGFKVDSIDDVKDIIYEIIILTTTIKIFAWGPIKKVFKVLDDVIGKSNFIKELHKAIRNKTILYIYDPEVLSDIIYKILETTSKSCIQGSEKLCENTHPTFNRKSFLTLVSQVFPSSKLEQVASELDRRLELVKNHLEQMTKTLSNFLATVSVMLREHNDINKSQVLTLAINIRIDDAWIRLEVHITFYDLVEDLRENEELRKLFEKNLELIGYIGVKKFLESLIEEKSKQYIGDLEQDGSNP